MWDKYLSLFGLSMIKFMFAPFAGVPLKLGYFETYFSCVAGAIVSATFFYFMSEFFMIRAAKKRKKKLQDAKQKGLELPRKKNFTFFNKMIVKVKHSLGIYGVTILAPLFFSIPVGTIIAAKFYGKKKMTFPLIVFGIFLNGIILTTLAYINRIF